MWVYVDKISLVLCFLLAELLVTFVLTGKQREGLLAVGFHSRAIWLRRQKVRKHSTYKTHTQWEKHISHTTRVALFQVGGGTGDHPRTVCCRVGWVLLRSVHVQLQPRSPMYPSQWHSGSPIDENCCMIIMQYPPMGECRNDIYLCLS